MNCRNSIQYFLVGLLLLFALPVSNYAEVVSLSLDLVPAAGPTNTFETVMTESKQGLGGDTNTATAGGSILFDLEITFNPVTQEAAPVSGIAFSNIYPGTVTFTDMSFSNYLGGFSIDTVALLGAGHTPAPFSVVVSDEYFAEDHAFVFNGGRILFSHGATNDLSLTPLTNTLNVGMGTIQVSPPTIVGNTATYDAVLVLPVGITGPVLDDVNFRVDMTMDGQLVAAGTFDRTIPVPEVNNAGGASGITTNSAVLQGELVSTGALPTTVSVYWGPTDGGADPAMWDHVESFGSRGVGPLSTNITGLLVDTTYYYRFYASNATAAVWADSSRAFTTDPDYSQYPYKMKISFSGYDGSETLTNFPALVRLGEHLDCFQFNQFGSSSGGDLRFSAADGVTPLNHEIEAWNTGGESLVWVQLPELDPGTTFIWAYWGKPGVSDWPGGVSNLQMWLRADLGVQTDPSGTVTTWEDQSGQINHATLQGGTPELIPGAVNGKPVVRFDPNGNSWFGFPEMTDIRTVFWVVREDTANSHFLLGDNNTYHFHRNGGLIWHGTYTHVNIKNGTTRLMGRVVDGTATQLGTGYRVVSVVTVGDVEASRISYDRNIAGRSWDGDIAEILIYNRALTDEEEQTVGSYLSQKYGLHTTYQDPASPAYTTDGSTWSEGYEGVWHMSEPNAQDSTAHAAHGTAVNNTDATGVIDGAQEFNAGAERIDLPASVSDGIGDHITVSGWGYLRTTTAAIQTLFTENYLGDGNVEFTLHGEGGLLKAGFFDGAWHRVDVPIILGQWEYLSATYDGHFVRLYREGVEVAASSDLNLGLPSGSNGWRIGHRWDGSDSWDGRIDEVRIASVARSSNWVWAAYNNQQSGSDFVTYDRVQGVTTPVISNHSGASGITMNSANMNGELTCTGAAPVEVSVYWGTTDGASNTGNWDHVEQLGSQELGLVSAVVTGLTADTTYYYRYYASNTFGEVWADSSPSFFTLTDLTDYPFRMKIAFTGCGDGGALTNFPALVVFNEGLAGFNYDQFASGAGADLRFTASDETTILRHEIEQWNMSGDSFVWVKVPELTSNTFVYAYWGNPAAVDPPPYTMDGSAWDAQYAGVWHLAETGGHNSPRTDSTSQGNTGTFIDANGNSVPSAPGPADGADGLNGDDDYVVLPDGFADFTGGLTYCIWIYPHSVQNWTRFITLSQGQNNDNILFAREATTDNLAFDIRTDSAGAQRVTAPGVIELNKWQMFVATQDASSNVVLYKNGVALQAGQIIMPANVTRTVNYLGNSAWPTDAEFDGVLDEARISTVARSSNWVCAAYLNVASNAAFNTYHVVESEKQPVVDNDGGASDVGLTSANLNGTLVTIGGAPTEVLVYWGTGDGGTDKSAWDHEEQFGQQAPGLLTTNVTGTSLNTNYYYRFYATNFLGDAWAPSSAGFGTLWPAIANADPLNDAGTAADLKAVLVTTGSAPTEVWAYWGRSPGGTDKSSWDQAVSLGPVSQGPVSTMVSVEADVTYYYRYYTSNFFGDAWADTVISFTTPIDNINPANYRYRMKIAVAEYDREETLNGFPVLVTLSETNLNNFSYADFASGVGADLRFTDSNKTSILSYEIDKWNIDGDSHVWVRVPQLNTNSCIYAYWGNPDTPTPPNNATDGSTWSANFSGVYHLSETNGVALDSTPNRDHGTPVNGVLQGQTGLVGTAYTYDGSNDRVNLTAAAGISGTDNYTLSAWVKTTDADGMIFSQWGTDGTAQNRLEFGLRNGGKAYLYMYTQYYGVTLQTESPAAVNDDQWHHLLVTRAPNRYNINIYIDGEQVITAYNGGCCLSMRANNGISLGRNPRTNGRYYSGTMEEMRISDGARSTNWIWAAYANQRLGSTFLTYGAGEDLGGYTDSDGDGIPDWWEQQHFGGITNCVATLDSDGDRINNLAEWIADTIPTNSSSYFTVKDIDDSSSFRIYFDSSEDRVYTLQFLDYLRGVGAWGDMTGQSRIYGTGLDASLVDTNKTRGRNYRIEVEVP